MGDWRGAAPQARASGRTASGGGGEWIERTVRFFYVQRRTVGLRTQLCLRAPDGCELGWKDFASGRVVIRDQTARGALAQAILEASGDVHLPVAAERVPGIALDIPAGAMLAHLRLRSAAVVVGKERTVDSRPRLDATFLWPGKRTVALGFVDLGSGTRHLSPDASPGLDPETRDQLLEAVAARRPHEPYP